jgi:endonuclease I
VYNEPFTWWTGTGGNLGTLTREHTYAQSWMPSNDGSPNWFQPGGKELPEYNDLHHLFPADQQNGNVKRSNYPFGEVVNATYTSPSGYGKLGTDINGKIVWEPRDEQKGDLARALFYMCTTYNGINGRDWSLSAISVAQQDEAILKKWHFQDLPDALEIARNEYIASVQHNRNPFIDSVNFVCHINFNNMTAIASPGSCGTTLASIKITSPSGGETWTAGETHAITWTSTNIDSVKIEYSIDGSPYTTINESVSAADGSYSWVVPNTPSANVLIRITQKNAASPISVASAIFTISTNTGVKEVDLWKAIEVYPNPSNGLIAVKNTTNRSGTCVLFDVTGRMIDKVILTQTETPIKMENKGVYILQISTTDGTIYKKLIVE